MPSRRTAPVPPGEWREGDEGDEAAPGREAEGEEWRNRLEIPEASGRALTAKAEELEAEAEQRHAVERMADDVTREIQKAHPLTWAHPPKRTTRNRKTRGGE